MQRFELSRDVCAAFDGERLVSRRPQSKSGDAAQWRAHTFPQIIANFINPEADIGMHKENR